MNIHPILTQQVNVHGEQKKWHHGFGNYWGNAGDWTTSAASLGYEVGTIPKVGAITVWTDENGGYGHVAYVTDVATDGQIQVTESNYNGSYYPSNIRGFFDPTKTSEGKVSYIYPPAGV